MTYNQVRLLHNLPRDRFSVTLARDVGQVNERATRFGSGLINKFKCTTDNKAFIGIYSQNRPEVHLLQ